MGVRLIVLTILAVITKAIIFASTAYAVISSNLPPFAKVLITTAVSATITGLFTVLAAVLATRYARRLREEVTHVKDGVQDVKRSLDLSKRTTDET